MAKDLKINDIPCVEVDLDYDKERELNVRLNKNMGEFDYDILADMFDVEELTDWGFNETELFGLEEPEYDDLTDEEKESPPKLQITFKTFEQQEKAIIEIAELLKKYEKV